MAEAELVPLSAIDSRLPSLEDWQVLLALRNEVRPWDGLITTDGAMIRLPRELAVLHQTKLTLVVAEAAGHDPVKATGLVLAHLPGICKRTRPDIPQVWILRTVDRNHERPWDLLGRIAARQGKSADELFAASRLSEAEAAKKTLR